MRTGAAGVLVGFGGEQRTTRRTLGIHAPIASAIADVAAARRDYLDGPVAAMSTSSPMACRHQRRHRQRPSRAVPTPSCSVLRSHDPPRHLVRVSTGAPAHHGDLPRGERVAVGSVGTLEQILFGPSRTADGTTNLVGALRRAMATTGYTDPKGIPARRGHRRAAPAFLTLGANHNVRRVDGIPTTLPDATRGLSPAPRPPRHSRARW